MAVLFSLGIYSNYGQIAKAESVKSGGLVIRAYGDSISAGDTLEDNANYVNGTHDICQGCFSKIFGDELISVFGGNVKSFAHSGDKTSDLVLILENQTSDENLAEFLKTDILTLCIGANNVLSAAVSLMPNYLLSGVNETELREILQTGLDNFNNDYTNIIIPTLTQNENAKVVVMTIYNPYLYLDLDDATVSASISSFISMADVKANFENMLSITMEYLDQMNTTIRDSAVDNKIYVADVKAKFDTFTANEYKQYINADASKLVINDFSDIANISSKISSACDPHPTASGQQQIANVFMDSFSYTKMDDVEKIENITDGETELTFNLNLYNYDNISIVAKKVVNGEESDVEVESYSNGVIKIKAKNLDGDGELYFIVNNDDEKVYTTNKIAFSNAIEPTDQDPVDPDPIDPDPVTPDDDTDPVTPDDGTGGDTTDNTDTTDGDTTGGDTKDDTTDTTDDTTNTDEREKAEKQKMQEVTSYLILSGSIGLAVFLALIIVISSFKKRY